MEDTKRSKSYLLEQHASIIMDTFRGQDNDTLKKLCAENNCDVVIVPHNPTNKSQPLDLSVNKAAKSLIQSKYNDWFVDWYNHVIKEKVMIVGGFSSAGISEAVQNAEDIYEKNCESI